MTHTHTHTVARDTHTHTQWPPTCQHTQFSTSSHPTMSQTCLAGQLDCATPQRDTALRDGDAGQGSTCLVPAAPPFTHPMPATPNAGCTWGTCPGFSPQSYRVELPSRRRCPTSLEGRPMAPGLPAPAPPLPQDLGTQTQPDLSLTLNTSLLASAPSILAAS